MISHMNGFCLMVDDYDRAVESYTKKLGFEVRVDMPFGNGLRWLVLTVAGTESPDIALCLAQTEEDRQRIGSQTGSYPLLVLYTNDFHQDYTRMKDDGIVFRGEPRTESWGTGILFEDLYGNMIYLLQPAD